MKIGVSSRWAHAVFGGVATLAAWTLVAQTALQFQSLQRLTNGDTVLKLTAPTNLNFRIDASTNLAAWRAVYSLKSSGVYQQTDSAAIFLGSRFYRASQLEGTNLIVGDHFPTDQGDVVVRPIQHASILLTWNGKVIYNDPSEGAFTGLPKADLILISHSHGDHFNANVIATLRNTNTILIAPQAVYSSLSATLKAQTIVMSNGTVTNALGINIEAIPAYNSNHPLGTGNGYVVTLGGTRLYFAGDTGDIKEMRALQNIDVAFVCINTPFTMTMAQAVSAVREFRPKVVIPYHFRNSDGTYTDLNAFKRQVGTDVGVEVRPRKLY